MSDFHGIIFAYSASPDLHELVSCRTAASLPFCGRYRLIDFALSSMMNAGIRNVGVIMQRDYQSLLDHIGSGKSWDMSRKSGGLRMLPPFGLPEYHTGNYTGTIEALNAVAPYVKDIKEKYVVLMQGNLCANIDLSEAMQAHIAGGHAVTAICGEMSPDFPHHRYLTDGSGTVSAALFDCADTCTGIPSLEAYIINRDMLVTMMDRSRQSNIYYFHRGVISRYLAEGQKMGVYVHRGYSRPIRDTAAYFRANMDMLRPELRRQVFLPQRPVRTRNKEEVSTYYGEDAASKNSLVADNCIIHGSLQNCILFSSVKVEKGAELRDCIVMRNSTVGAGSRLEGVIMDKDCTLSPGTELKGSGKLPFVIPKGTKL